MQMEYISLENTFPSKTVVFHFEFSYVPLADVCLYCSQGMLEQKTNTLTEMPFHY